MLRLPMLVNAGVSKAVIKCVGAENLSKPMIAAAIQEAMAERGKRTDLDATNAAKRAGYKHSDVGRRMVTKSHIAAAIAKGQAKRVERTEITQDYVLASIAAILEERNSGGKQSGI